MPLIEQDENNIPLIVDLSENEKIRWRSEFGVIRKREQLPPAEYIDRAVEKMGGHGALRNAANETTKLILDIRETAWNVYIQHEQMVCGQAMEQLLKTNPATRNILQDMINRDGIESFQNCDSEDFLDKIAGVVGELSGRIFPYPYELSKSVTQSRRSRAGTAFERVIRHVIDIYGYPCDDQSKIGLQNFDQGNLGKIVDGLIPGIDAYKENRSKCAILTMKTTLRERWQEVVEELHRTNVPHVYLLTLDEKIGDSLLDTMRNHNITLVAPIFVKERNEGKRNLISFEELFNHQLPQILKYWSAH